MDPENSQPSTSALGAHPLTALVARASPVWADSGYSERLIDVASA
ncbi:hypothetical protein ABT052_40965 [Streptomyces sp. NPDC002766]